MFGEVADGIKVGLAGSDVVWCDFKSGKRSAVLAEYEFFGVEYDAVPTTDV